MAKRIDEKGKSYRVRRGKKVEIPKEWVGRATRKQTIRKRDSKKVGKRKKSHGWKPYHNGDHGRPPDLVPFEDFDPYEPRDEMEGLGIVFHTRDRE